MVIKSDGTLEGVGDDPKKHRKLIAAVNCYAKQYVIKLAAGEIEKPSAADCFYCVMREEKTGKPLGELTKDRDHILSHLEEKYFVPSLVVNAVESKPISRIASDWLCVKFNHDDIDLSMFDDIARRQIESSLKRYLKLQLGLSA